MAYALQYLVQILERDQHKHHLSPATRSEIDSFLEKARTLRDLIEATSFEISEDLRSRIKDVAYEAEDAIESHIVVRLCNPVSVEEGKVYEAEDAIESHIVDEVVNPVSEEEDDAYDLELTDVTKELESIKEQIITLKTQFELPPPVVSSSPEPFRKSPCVRGFNRDISRLENQLISEQKSQLQVIPIVGIGGSGKTELAAFLYKKSSIIRHVETRSWTTISQEFNLRLTLLALLGCLLNITYEMRWETDDQQLGKYLHANLVNKKYLIVLDDIWHISAWDTLKRFFPDDNNGSRIILTTREWNFAEYARTSFHPHQMHPIDDDSSWSLFRDKVFGGMLCCPPELVETGFRIARNCKGHPLTIITIAGVLSASSKTLDAWQRVESQHLESANMRDSIKEDKMPKVEVDPSLKGFAEFFAKDGLQLMSQLMDGQSELKIIPIVGGAKSTTGKTILARLLYDRASGHFDARAQVKIKETQTMGIKQRNVLATLQEDLLDSLRECGISQVNDPDLGVRLHKTLKNRRYLIVVDDIRDSLTWGTMSRFFPNENNGSRVILTAREWSHSHRVNPFRLDSYWEFLLGKIATLISTSEVNQKFWKLAEEEYASPAESRKRLKLELLSKNYNTLPYHLKPCFLYVGAFPEDHEIKARMIRQMWIAEGFVSPVAENSLEDTASMYLESLISRNLLFACGKDTNGKAISFKIHDVLWKFCRKKALDEKFWWFKDLDCQNILDDGEIVRRVSVDPNCLPSDDEDEDMPFARSFLCIGPASLDLTSILFVLRLLRVLDLIGLQFVQFPKELLQLINLRYMALKCYSDLPSSISIFRNLQTLIALDVLSLPSELWELTQLRFIGCSTNCIWNISGKGESVRHEEMHTLEHIPASEVTYEFLRHNPNLRHLSIVFDDSAHVSVPLDCLKNLEVLHCLYVGSECRSDFLHYLRLPASLKTLSLSFCIIHSEFMTTHVGMLPLLESLVLAKCDFVGLEWEPAEGGFTRLKDLHMDDLNIVHWRATNIHFPGLQKLAIRGCRAMKEIPFGIGEIPTLELIEVGEKCSRSVLTSAKRIKSELMNLGNYFRVMFHGGAENKEPSGCTTASPESSSRTPEPEVAKQKLEKSYNNGRQNSTVIMAEEADARGYTSLSTCDYTDAIKHYTDAINLSPSDHLLYFYRLDAHCYLSQFSEALLDAQKVVQLKPDWSIGYLHLGKVYSALHNYNCAISAYEKGLEIDPTNDEVNDEVKYMLFFEKGEEAFSNGNFVGAIQHYTDAIKLRPTYHILYNSRSLAHTRLKQPHEALSDAQKSVQLNPNRSIGYIHLGNAYSDLGNCNCAISAFEKGHKIDPTNDDLKYTLSFRKGLEAFSNDNFVGAIQHCTDAIKLRPSYHILYDTRSVAHTRLKQPHEALSDAQKSVQLNPDWSTGYIRLGNAYLHLGNCNCAISAFEKGLEIDPTNEQLKYMLFFEKGLEAFSNGNVVGAIEHLTDAIKLHPSHHMFYRNRSLAYKCLKQPYEALSDAQKVVQLKPDWIQGYNELGHAYSGLRKYKDAVSAYEKGFEIDPSNDDLKTNLINAKGVVAWNTSNFVDAIQHYTDAIKLRPSGDIFYHNRSEAHASLNQLSKAMSDAQEAVRLGPDRCGGYFCLGDVYLGLRIYNDAVSTYMKGLEIDPTDDELKSELKSALTIAKAAWAIRKRKDNHQKQQEVK